MMTSHFWTRRRSLTVLVVLQLTLLMAGCDKGREPVEGFVLPDGDIERGKEVFATIGCRYCHKIDNEEFPPFEADPVLSITLGGKVHRVKDYGELLTSIVVPQHVVSAHYRATLEADERRDASSPMPEFNDVMTVTQLIDLASYLHSRYELMAEYRGYYYVY